MRNSKDIKKRWPNSISMGDSGKGKTWLIGTMLAHHKPYIIDTENGIMTIKEGDFDYEIVNTFAEFKKEVNWFLKNYKKHGYTILVIDGLSRLQQYLIDGLLPDGVYKLDFDLWTEILAKSRKIINTLTKELPVPVHCTVMAGESKDPITKVNKIFPNVQGAFKYDLLGYFDVCFFHDVFKKDNKDRFMVQTKGDQRIIAKSRLAGLKKFEENNYSIIANLIKGD